MPIIKGNKSLVLTKPPKTVQFGKLTNGMLFLYAVDVDSRNDLQSYSVEELDKMKGEFFFNGQIYKTGKGILNLINSKINVPFYKQKQSYGIKKNGRW